MARVLLENPTHEGATTAMLLSYRAFPVAFGAHLADLFTRIVDGRSLPLVFHCSAGKDRTGFVAAMLLAALGVSRETILDDYMLTAEYWNGPRSEASLKLALHSIFGTEPPSAVIPPLVTVQQAYLNEAFASILERYKSIDHYLERAVGLTADRRQALRTILLEQD